MSSEIAHSIAETVRDAAVESCWRQWHVLGFPAAIEATERPSAIIDPEALVLLSLSVAPHERRLEDALAWWARAGAVFLSLQRIRTLARAFPDETHPSLGAFARAATESGDRRWRRYAGAGQLAEGRRTKGPDEPTLLSPPALMVRLRAGFGVGVKTDLLSYLIGSGKQGATIKEAREATGYTAPALRTAAAEMERAGLIRTAADRPVRYVAQTAPWEALLRIGREERDSNAVLPQWRDWFPFFAFLAGVLAWSAQETDIAYVMSSRARDLVLPRLPLFVRHQIDIPNPEVYPGSRYLEGFKATLERVTAWMIAHL